MTLCQGTITRHNHNATIHDAPLQLHATTPQLHDTIVTFLPNYLILSHYLTAYHWDCLSFILSPIPSTVRALYHPVTCLSGLVTFYNIPQHSITNTGTTSISGTTTDTLSISGFPSTPTSSIRLALCTI
jgi:hypothetical protein